MIRTCRICGIEKEISEYEKSPRHRNGFRNECKSCMRIYRRNRRKDIREKINNYKRTYLKNHPQKREIMKKTYNEKYPEKREAGLILLHAIQQGKIKKGTCNICGDSKVHGHHPNYNKPLDVIWLCTKHHNDLHNGKPLQVHPTIERRRRWY